MAKKKLTIRQLAKRCIEAVDSSYRIKWQRRNKSGIVPHMTTHTWDGSGVLRMSEYNPLLALHDVAHVMLAAKSRRKLPEFGLGPDPSNTALDVPAPMVVSTSEAQTEEDKTCQLHWAMAAYVEGKRGADQVEDYLNMFTIVPSEEEIRRMSRFRGLPKDFVKEVLMVKGQWEEEREKDNV